MSEAVCQHYGKLSISDAAVRSCSSMCRTNAGPLQTHTTETIHVHIGHLQLWKTSHRCNVMATEAVASCNKGKLWERLCAVQGNTKFMLWEC